MMTLRLMQKVVATVDDQWESPLADEIVQHWAHDEGRAKYWRASANFIFFFKDAGRDRVLRFNHTSERTVAAIQSELDHVNALAGQGICVAKPILSRSGNYVESVATPHGLFHAVVFEALQGEQVELDELTPAQFVRWGHALGELHNATAQLRLSGRPTWEAHLEMASETLPVDEKVARQALENLREQLHQLAINEDNFGLIHYDFELDNIIWNGEQPSIIDFDDSALYWFVADIALALSELFGDSGDKVDFQHESYVRFIQGYRKARPIDDQELRLIPRFLHLQNLVNFAKLHQALTPVNPAGELPWMAGLRDKLAAKMDFYRDEFARVA